MAARQAAQQVEAVQGGIAVAHAEIGDGDIGGMLVQRAEQLGAVAAFTADLDTVAALQAVAQGGHDQRVVVRQGDRQDSVVHSYLRMGGNRSTPVALGDCVTTNPKFWLCSVTP